MKICMIAEGSYPYITGGVSSWIHQLITNMPEHDFLLLTLMPDKSKKGEFKYTLPANVVEIKELLLDELFNSPGKRNKAIHLGEAGQEELSKLLSFSDVNWDVLFDIFEKNRQRGLSGGDVQMSAVFYETAKKVYEEKYSYLGFTDFYWTLRSMYRTFFELLLEEYPQADLYHAVSTGYAGLVASIASHRHGKAFVLTEHGIYTREREEELIKAPWVKGDFKELWIDYFYQMSDCAYKKADKVISLFGRNKEIQVEIGCPEYKIQIIPNGIKIENFHSVVLEVEKRDGKEGINVCAIVRVVPIKDIITMIDAFAVVNSKIKDVNFYILGPTDEDPDYFEECKNYRDFLGLKNLVFTGQVDVKEYLKKTDILVLTSISEGQPLVFLEGLASRLPLVSTNVGDYRSLVLGEYDEFGPAGLVSSVMDSVGIAQSIILLAQNKNLREQYGKVGYNRVSKYYRFEDLMEKYRDIYRTFWLRS